MRQTGLNSPAMPAASSAPRMMPKAITEVMSDRAACGPCRSAAKLAVLGSSNGGLLVTATMLQRPELFGAVLADVPVIDALRLYLSENGLQQVDQWGTPDDPVVLPAMRANSPVHNVVNGTCYPAALITTSRNDDRMPPWHACRLAAAVQDSQACTKPFLLHVRGSGGHGGGDPGGWLNSVAIPLAFLALAALRDGAVKRLLATPFPARLSQLLHGKAVHRERKPQRRKGAFTLVRDQQADSAESAGSMGGPCRVSPGTVGVSNASGTSISVQSPAVASNSAP